ncbi:MAG: response regulator transcription factor [Candidatus Gastranaerophilales bacterium]|nr:response regulator transcription factor [Candidatus Gastranaerophilales bacterium]
MNKISIYIVEDYLLTRVGLKHTLAGIKGLKILGDFEAAEECILAMQKEVADIIFMDLGLPGMNGIEATKLLKEKYPSTKIIVLTSHEKDDTVLASISAGADAYCMKDPDDETIVNAIASVTKGALWLDSQVASIPAKYMPRPDISNINNLYPVPNNDIKLSDREKEVLKLMIQGKTNPEIATEIMVSTHTIKAHVASILVKLDVQDRVQAAVKATKLNLVEQH